MSDNKASHQHPDIEKGDQNSVNNNERPRTGNGTARVINVSENDGEAGKAPVGGGAASKWGKFLAGAASATANNTKTQAPVKNVTLPQKQDNTTRQVNVSKPGSKWGKMFAAKQEPIEEKDEENPKSQASEKSNLRKADSTDSGILKSDKNLDQISEESIDSGPLTTRDVNISAGPLTVVPGDSHLIASLYDIKLEIKEEIESLNQKMTKIDLQIGDILKMFSPSSSPCSSQTSSSSSSRGNSNSSTANNSIMASPKRASLPSSPRHVPMNVGVGSSSIDSGGTSSPMPRKGSSDSGSSAGFKHEAKSKRYALKGSSDSHSNSSSGSRPGSKSSRKSNSGGSKRKVAPSEMVTLVPAKDEDHVPIKDRDLDIL